jgi:hypothetical protein
VALSPGSGPSVIPSRRRDSATPAPSTVGSRLGRARPVALETHNGRRRESGCKTALAGGLEVWRTEAPDLSPGSTFQMSLLRGRRSPRRVSRSDIARVGTGVTASGECCHPHSPALPQPQSRSHRLAPAYCDAPISGPRSANAGRCRLGNPEPRGCLDRDSRHDIQGSRAATGGGSGIRPRIVHGLDQEWDRGSAVSGSFSEGGETVWTGPAYGRCQLAERFPRRPERWQSNASAALEPGGSLHPFSMHSFSSPSR